MSEKILIITTNTILSAQIIECLGDAGLGTIYVVGASRIALEKMQVGSWSHVIIDLAFDEVNILALSQAIRDISPDVEVLFFDEDRYPGLDKQMPGIVEKLVDLSNIVTVIRQGAASDIVLDDERNLSWRENREIAAKFLQQYLPISSAMGLVLINEKTTWAYAGRLSEKVVERIKGIVLEHWSENKMLANEVFRDVRSEPALEDDPLENCQDELMCYVDVGSIVGDCGLYATNLDARFSLAFVFVSRTPLSQIRQRVRRIRHALNDGEDFNDIDSKQEVIDENYKTIGVHDYNRDAIISLMDKRLYPEDLAFPPNPKKQPGINREQYFGYVGDDREKLFPFKRARLKSRKSEVPGLVDDQLESSLLKINDINIEQISKSDPMMSYSPSGIWSRINYCCILIPRLPRHRIEDFIKDQLFDWMHTIGLAHNFKMMDVSVFPTFLQWVCEVKPIMSAAEVIEIVRQQTSKKIFMDFPNFALDNTSGDFWASECLVFSRSELLEDTEVHTFVQQVRKRQGVDL